jgi:hypothetical protein
MKKLKAAAAAAEIVSDDSMVIAGGILPGRANGQEGLLRACALIVEADVRLCLVSCDVLILTRDIIDRVGRKIEAECGVPFENFLVTVTHTHHAPATAAVHGYVRDEAFCARLEESILAAVRAAAKKLASSGNSAEAEMLFGLGQEATVGANSRLLMKDGTIAWAGYDMNETVRPTGPMDAELPVVALRKKDGSYEALFFNHSSHNIGGYKPGIRSPAFYGLAAQEIEKKVGGTVFFLPGAFGSTHNLHVPPVEAAFRVKSAIEETLPRLQPLPASPLKSIKVEFEYRVRNFDEAAEDEAVSYWCNKWQKNPQPTIDVFRRMREALREHQGEVRRSWMQAILLGDVAFVGIPGELFTVLGLEIKRRSPFRYTYIINLANDWIGYLPDKRGFELGGYQVWTGLHSLVAPGTGESVVEEALRLLDKLYEAV